jgi:CTP synthase
MVELPDHPHFIGCQFHPEFKSKPHQPHPLFTSFVGAAIEHHARQGRQLGGTTEAHVN